jgi:hypothetical protein
MPKTLSLFMAFPIHPPVAENPLAMSDEAVVVMSELHQALSDLLGSIPGSVRRAVDLQRALDLDTKLAWQLFRIARSNHPLAEVQNLPASASVRRLLVAVRKQRIPAGVVERLERSFERVDRFMLTHTSDREGLVSMLSGLGGRNDDQFKLKVRKSLFRSAADFWGIHAQMLVRTSIFHGKPGGGYVEDSALIQATVGLERVRASQPADFVMMMRTKSDPLIPGGPTSAPIRHPAELLSDFCTGPLPQFSPVPVGGDQVESRLRLPPGRTGAATLYSMQLYEQVSNSLQVDYYGRTFVTVPAEALVWELLMPVGWTDPATIRGAMYGCREHPEQGFTERPGDRTPQQESVEYLGTLDGAPPLEGSPKHGDAVRQALGRLGWLDTKYDVYRCRVQYPVLHTLMAIRVDALPR